METVETLLTYRTAKVRQGAAKRLHIRLVIEIRKRTKEPEMREHTNTLGKGEGEHMGKGGGEIEAYAYAYRCELSYRVVCSCSPGFV